MGRKRGGGGLHEVVGGGERRVSGGWGVDVEGVEGGF